MAKSRAADAALQNQKKAAENETERIKESAREQWAAYQLKCQGKIDTHKQKLRKNNEAWESDYQNLVDKYNNLLDSWNKTYEQLEKLEQETSQDIAKLENEFHQESLVAKTAEGKLDDLKKIHAECLSEENAAELILAGDEVTRLATVNEGLGNKNAELGKQLVDLKEQLKTSKNEVTTLSSIAPDPKTFEFVISRAYSENNKLKERFEKLEENHKTCFSKKYYDYLKDQCEVQQRTLEKGQSNFRNLNQLFDQHHEGCRDPTSRLMVQDMKEELKAKTTDNERLKRDLEECQHHRWEEQSKKKIPTPNQNVTLNTSSALQSSRMPEVTLSPTTYEPEPSFFEDSFMPDADLQNLSQHTPATPGVVRTPRNTANRTSPLTGDRDLRRNTAVLEPETIVSPAPAPPAAAVGGPLPGSSMSDQIFPS